MLILKLLCAKYSHYKEWEFYADTQLMIQCDNRLYKATENMMKYIYINDLDYKIVFII